MDSSRLHLEVLESGDRMVEALAEETRKLSNHADQLHATCREHPGMGGRKLGYAAERYASALGAFREALLAEHGLTPVKNIKKKVVPSSKCRGQERARPARTASPVGRMDVIRAEEHFAVSTRTSKA
jgi:hypothetical protein